MKQSPTKYTIFFLFIGIVICFGCCPAPQRSIPVDLQQSIDAFYSAVEAGDTEARIALYADSITMMPNHWTMILGKEPIAQNLRAGDGWVFKLRDRKIIDMDVSGNIAYTVNSYYYTYHADTAQPQWHKTKNVHIWKKNTNGSWKLQVDIWNSDVTLSAFSGE